MTESTSFFPSSRLFSPLNSPPFHLCVETLTHFPSSDFLSPSPSLGPSIDPYQCFCHQKKISPFKVFLKADQFRNKLTFIATSSYWSPSFRCKNFAKFISNYCFQFPNSRLNYWFDFCFCTEMALRLPKAIWRTTSFHVLPLIELATPVIGLVSSPF